MILCLAHISLSELSRTGNDTNLHHYCITRSDLPAGVQAAQLIHAAGYSASRHYEALPPGTFAYALVVPDEAALQDLSIKLKNAEIRHSRITESDAPYNGQLMAIGVRPDIKDKLKKYLSNLPLLGSKK